MPHSNTQNTFAPLPFKQLSAQDFLAFGVEQVAYVRRVKMLDRFVYAIHAADGTPLSVVDSETLALQAVAQHELDPVRVH